MDGTTREPRRGQGRRALAGAVALSLVFGVATPAAAAPAIQRRAAEVPLSVEGPTPDLSDRSRESASGGAEADASVVEGPAPPPAPSGPPPPRYDPEAAPLLIAVGLGPSAPGSREELAIVAALVTSAGASSVPKTSVRRLRGGAGEARAVCRQQRDDLVIMVDYVPERDAPVLVAHDCVLDRALGTRPAEAADEPGLWAALWEEHEALVRAGAQARRPPLLPRRTRTILIAGGSLAVFGVALGLILASALRPSTVVLTVSP